MRVRPGFWLVVIFSNLVNETTWARDIPDYGLAWSTVGHPGNRAASEKEAPRFYSRGFPPPGGVNYTFRITKTEVTAGQWFEFVRAYEPYAPPNARFDFQFTSYYIRPTNPNTAQSANYVLVPGAESLPVSVSWNYAVRFVNWLQSGKQATQASFDQGVYDTSLIHKNPDGITWAPPPTRSSSAQFWIPSLDESIKAGFYDPNRYGSGLDGYWLYPNQSNMPLIPGWPEDGGQTDAGLDDAIISGRVNPVGSYPSVRSPWGLLDVSGGEDEWSDSGLISGAVLWRGTHAGGLLPDYFDRVDEFSGSAPGFGGHGFRIAGVVPAPGAATLVGVGAPLLWRRNRKRRLGPN